MSTGESRDRTWSREMWHGWEVPTFDLVVRSNEERARMLSQVGLSNYGYLPCADPYGRRPDLTTSQLDIDAEITAMIRHGVEIRGWYSWVNTQQPAADEGLRRTLDSLVAHEIRPRLWLPQSWGDPDPETDTRRYDDPASQRSRVLREAERVAAFVDSAREANLDVDLYNHKGWYGLLPNQLAILDELDRSGITDVGLVYNFTHSSSAFHDDGPDFADLWDLIAPRVRTVHAYVIGRREIDMLRVIYRSKWSGNIGLIPMPGGDSAHGLANSIWGLERVINMIETDDGI